jgi:hypothetical protein
MRARGCGVRHMARYLSCALSTISRELARNAATRGGGFEYRATAARWHAERLGARKMRPNMPCEITHPQPVGRRSLECPIDVIPWTGGCLVRKGRAQALPANRPLNPIRTHQAGHGTARDTETFST